jgi:thioredoxin-related protein
MKGRKQALSRGLIGAQAPSLAERLGRITVAACAIALSACDHEGGVTPASPAATTNRPVPTPPSLRAPNRNTRGPFDETADSPKAIAAALTKAKADGQRVLLVFGANWCPDCIVLAKIFDSKTVQPFLETHFQVVTINVGRRDKNLDLVEKYGSPIEKGIPAVVMLAAHGQVLATNQAGELANARTATASEILAFLRQWASLKP